MAEETARPPAGDPAEVVFVDIDNRETLALIGSVTTHFAYFEALIEDMIAGLMQADVADVYTLTANINISTRIPALLALARSKLEETDFKELSGITDMAKPIVTFRNKVVHGMWAKSDHPDIFVVSAVKSAGKIKYQVEYDTSEYLEWLDRQLHAVSTALLNFGREFGLIGSDSAEP
jgi:hypothetical protein